MSEEDLNLQEQKNDDKDLNQELEIKGNADEETFINIHI